MLVPRKMSGMHFSVVFYIPMLCLKKACILKYIAKPRMSPEVVPCFWGNLGNLSILNEFTTAAQFMQSIGGLSKYICVLMGPVSSA